jgi:hypothetical protein
MVRAAKKETPVNKEIDAMIKKLQDDFSSLPPSDKINAIKVAIMWEKTKHTIKEGGEGDFFNNGGDDED